MTAGHVEPRAPERSPPAESCPGGRKESLVNASPSGRLLAGHAGSQPAGFFVPSVPGPMGPRPGAGLTACDGSIRQAIRGEAAA